MALPIDQLIQSIKAQTDAIKDQGNSLGKLASEIRSQRKENTDLRKNLTDMQKQFFAGSKGINDIKKMFSSSRNNTPANNRIIQNTPDKGFFSNLFTKVFGPSKYQLRMMDDTAAVREGIERVADDISFIKSKYTDNARAKERILLANAIARAFEQELPLPKEGGSGGGLLGGMALAGLAAAIVSGITAVLTTMLTSLGKIVTTAFEKALGFFFPRAITGGVIPGKPGAEPRPGETVKPAEGAKPGAPGKVGAPGSARAATGAASGGVLGRLVSKNPLAIAAGAMLGAWGAFTDSGNNFFKSLGDFLGIPDFIEGLKDATPGGVVDKYMEEKKRKELEQEEKNRASPRHREGIVERVTDNEGNPLTPEQIQENKDRAKALQDEQTAEKKALKEKKEKEEEESFLRQKMNEALKGALGKILDIEDSLEKFMEEKGAAFYKEKVVPMVNDLFTFDVPLENGQTGKLNLISGFPEELGNVLEDAYKKGKEMTDPLKTEARQFIQNNITNNNVGKSDSGPMQLAPAPSKNGNKRAKDVWDYIPD